MIRSIDSIKSRIESLFESNHLDSLENKSKVIDLTKNRIIESPIESMIDIMIY